MIRVLVWAPAAEKTAAPPFGAAVSSHIAAYKNPAARRSSAAVWALLAKTLAENGLPAGEVAFTKTGKPYFVNGGPYFSLSHAGALCAVSVADVPTGVDIELCDRAVSPRMIEKCLSPAEKAAFDGDFIRLWCRKECILKLTGEGLTGYPNAVETGDGRWAFEERLVTFAQQTYRLSAAFDASGQSEQEVLK